MKIETLVGRSIRQQPKSESCDICIVGAGAAGCYLARRLAANGIDVILLEAGGSRGVDPVSLGVKPHFLRDYYPGAIEGRVFGLGGSTSRWGGLLMPHSRHDLRDSGDESQVLTWKHIVDVVSTQADTVLRQLGYRQPVDFEGYAKDHLESQFLALERVGISVKASLFLPFRRRNLFGLLGKMPAQGCSVKVYTNAVAKTWRFDNSNASDGKIVRLTAVSRDGTELSICAKRFVIAAGTIESARILLELQSQAPGNVRLSRDIGRFLGDHLSTVIADVAEDSLKAATNVYAPRFQGNWMRSFRFIESRTPPDAPRAFAHFVFENENAGFRLAKKVLTAIQAQRIPKVSIRECLEGLGGVIGLASGRYIHSRLFIPPRTKTRLQLDIEQSPNVENRILLGKESDEYGRRVAMIDWRMSKGDLNTIRSSAERLLALWNRDADVLPRLIPRDLECDSQKPHDAYHPVGACRMGVDGDSVVDLRLRVRGLRNIWLLSTGVLPSAGTANPTFSLLCLAEQLVDEIRQDCSTSANGQGRDSSGDSLLSTVKSNEVSSA